VPSTQIRFSVHTGLPPHVSPIPNKQNAFQGRLATALTWINA
jgi:hypothetical protein